MWVCMAGRGGRWEKSFFLRNQVYISQEILIVYTIHLQIHPRKETTLQPSPWKELLVVRVASDRRMHLEVYHLPEEEASTFNGTKNRTSGRPTCIIVVECAC